MNKFVTGDNDAYVEIPADPEKNKVGSPKVVTTNLGAAPGLVFRYYGKSDAVLFEDIVDKAAAIKRIRTLTGRPVRFTL